MEFETKFWSNIDRRDPDKCWEWRAGCNSSGYGELRFNGQVVLAHRLSFFIAHGRWPQPCCLHSCDNRSCCNPAHLWEGTRSDNVADMIAKGRGARGERNGRAKLSDLQREQIRERYAAGGLTQEQLGQVFGVSRQAIQYVLNEESCRDRDRVLQARRTCCPQGHPYSGDNLYVCPKGNQYCRRCHRERSRSARLKRALLKLVDGSR